MILLSSMTFARAKPLLGSNLPIQPFQRYRLLALSTNQPQLSLLTWNLFCNKLRSTSLHWKKIVTTLGENVAPVKKPDKIVSLKTLEEPSRDKKTLLTMFLMIEIMSNRSDKMALFNEDNDPVKHRKLASSNGQSGPNKWHTPRKHHIDNHAQHNQMERSRFL